jgi:hypothetical protein
VGASTSDAPLTLTIDSSGSECIMVEVESHGVNIWILLVVKKMVAGWGVLAKKLAKFSSCKIFLPPVVCQLTHFRSQVGLTWARWAGSWGQVTLVHELPQRFTLTNMNSQLKFS